MSRLSPGELPAFYEYDDVPFLVYTGDDGRPVAVSDLGVISTQLPEIVFEGEKIDGARFSILAQKRSVTLDVGTRYKEVLDFAQSLQTPKNSLETSDFLDLATNQGGGNPNHDPHSGQFTTGSSSGSVALTDGDLEDMSSGINIAHNNEAMARKVMDDIYKRQGFHAKPTVVSDDKFDDIDGEIQYRGIYEHEGGDKFKEQFKSGDKHYIGEGQFGNGTYITPDIGMVDQYGSGSKLQMIITKKKPKSITWRDALHQAQDTSDRLGAKAESMRGGSDELKRIKLIYMSRVIKDPGVYAASKGYDMMTVTPKDTPFPQSVIFNRGILTVSDKYYEGASL